MRFAPLGRMAVLWVSFAVLAACGGGSGASPPPAPTRSWMMGFSVDPPRPTAAAVLQGIDLWSQRAEIAVIHEELPWTDLIAGMTPDAILARDKVQLVAYLRGKGLKLYYMNDLSNGLARGQESATLVALGRSITEPAIQQIYRAYVLAVARTLKPEYLGLAAETNLIRLSAPAPLYAAVVQAANAAAADLSAAGDPAMKMVSVQVETAWGVLGGNGPYAGVEQDFADFPFQQVLGLSSYPYFSYAQPEAIPPDYYSRLLAGRKVPVMVAEGGWTSASVGTVMSSPDLQARYIARQAQLLDSVSARAVTQLLFADVDLTTVTPPVPANLPLFASIGVTDSNFNPKPALAQWDAQHAKRLLP